MRARSCVGFCVTLDDVGVWQVQRAILHEAKRGMGLEEVALCLVKIMGFSELKECNNVCIC